jgi:hypothetical protein
MQFYKGVALPDVLIGFVILLLVTLIVTSNLPYKIFVALGLVCLSVPAFITVGEEKIYMTAWNLIRHLFSRKTYLKNGKDGSTTAGLFPFDKIDGDCVVNKDGTFTGVLSVKPIEFRLLSGVKQDFMIDGALTNILNGLGAGQEAAIVKLEKPLNLDAQLEHEADRIRELIQNYEGGILTEAEYKARLNVIEDRACAVDGLNGGATTYGTYYLAVYDRDRKSLFNTLNYCKSLFNSCSMDANILGNAALYEFVKSYIGYFPAPVPVEEPPVPEPPVTEPETPEPIYADSDAPELSDLSTLIPDKVEFQLMRTRQDNKSLSHFVINGYPMNVYNAWGGELFDMPDTKVVMKLRAVEKAKAVRRIDNAIMELSARGSNKASAVIDKATHVETLSELLTRLQNDNETLIDVTLIVTAYDNLGESMVRRAVKRRLRELGFNYAEAVGRQSDAFLTSGLSVYDKLKISRGIQSSSVAACFPFVSNAVIDDGGLYLGENNLPVFLDFFKRDGDHLNSNMIIIGKSGSGKSYAAKTLLANLASCGTKVFCLDPESEYGKLTEALGGKVLDVASAKYGKINPFHVIASLDDENDDGSKNSFFAHLQFLEEFFRQILQGINTDCLEMTNRFVLETYALKGITQDADFVRLKPDDYPILDDLAGLIEKKLGTETDEYTKSCLKIIVNYLSKFKSGGRNSALWNGASSFDASENFVCFDFQKLLANKNNAIANAQMLLVLKWLENEVIKNRDYNIKNGTSRKIAVVIDEAHLFIDDKYSVALDFMFSLAKRIRKYDGMQIVITQNVKDFAGMPETARKSMAIINVSQYSLIFGLSPNDMTDLCALYEKAGQINEAEQASIIYNPRGCAFLISSATSRTNIRVTATPHVESLFKQN